MRWPVISAGSVWKAFCQRELAVDGDNTPEKQLAAIYNRAGLLRGVEDPIWVRLWSEWKPWD
jgi:hypothetical protein